ncbi:MAG: hypothetical protein OQK58_11550, partial [Gammaproteobacteria bacterium]|nr:hypothetical protein [Gammaproteobacteria bacterium]
MLLSSIIQALLTNQDVPYCVVNSAKPENLSQTYASISLLKDSTGIVMAIYSSGHQLDLLTLKALVERPELRFMSLEELDETLYFLKNTAHKPFNKTLSKEQNENEIQLIIDEPMSSQSSVLLVTNNPEEHVQVDIWDMQIMIENALIGGIFSHAINSQSPLAGKLNSNLLTQLKNIDHLPVMPSIAAN